MRQYGDALQQPVVPAVGDHLPTLAAVILSVGLQCGEVADGVLGEVTGVRVEHVRGDVCRHHAALILHHRLRALPKVVPMSVDCEMKVKNCV